MVTPPEPRPSATVVVFRTSGDREDEILMVQRGRGAKFMGGAWVFPGGTVSAADRAAVAEGRIVPTSAPDAPVRAAGLRELAEEADIWVTTPPLGAGMNPDADDVYAALEATGRRLDGTRMLCFARWITPTAVPMRFDTRFYAVPQPPDAVARPDGVEVDAVAWVTPSEALARAARGEWSVPFPTAKNLELLARWPNLDELAAHIAGVGEVPAIQPRIVERPDGSMAILLPGEPGFDEADEGFVMGPDQLARLAAATGEGPTPS